MYRSMTRQVKARRATSRKPYQPRDFWLAGIGAASLARRQLLSAYAQRSEEHTSELQSLMRISYAVFCLKKKKHTHTHTKHHNHQHRLSHARERTRYTKT